MLYHPDKNHEAGAEEKFKQVQGAYAKLLANLNGEADEDDGARATRVAWRRPRAL